MKTYYPEWAYQQCVIFLMLLGSCRACLPHCLLAVHSVVRKVAQYMADVLEDSRDKVQENLLANGGKLAQVTGAELTLTAGLWSHTAILGVHLIYTIHHIDPPSPSSLPVDLVTYITRFQWDMAKYPIKQSLKNISEIISKASHSQPPHGQFTCCLLTQSVSTFYIE